MQKISVLLDAIFLKVIDETNKICLLFISIMNCLTEVVNFFS